MSKPKTIKDIKMAKDEAIMKTIIKEANKVYIEKLPQKIGFGISLLIFLFGIVLLLLPLDKTPYYSYEGTMIMNETEYAELKASIGNKLECLTPASINKFQYDAPSQKLDISIKNSKCDLGIYPVQIDYHKDGQGWIIQIEILSIFIGGMASIFLGIWVLDA